MMYIVFIEGIVKNPNDVRIYVREACTFIVIYKQRKGSRLVKYWPLRLKSLGYKIRSKVQIYQSKNVLSD